MWETSNSARVEDDLPLTSSSFSKLPFRTSTVDEALDLSRGVIFETDLTFPQATQSVGAENETASFVSPSWLARELPESEIQAVLGKAAQDLRAREESRKSIALLDEEIADLDAEVIAHASDTATAQGRVGTRSGMWNKIKQFESDPALGQLEIGKWASVAGRSAAACFLAELIATGPSDTPPSWQYLSQLSWSMVFIRWSMVDDFEMRNELLKGMLRDFRRGQLQAFEEVLQRIVM